MAPTAIQRPYKNRILASLPAADIQRLVPHLTPMALKRNQTLHDLGAKVQTIYFPEDAICSIVVNLKNGTTVEVGVIGRDGFIGLPGILGSGHSTNRSFIQLPGSGFSVKASLLRAQFEESKEFRTCLLRGVQGYLIQTAQTAACNRVHELEERLARWLLMCHDRMRRDDLPITHEFLAMMLGTRRSSVTVAAGMLSKAGLIEYSRGKVRIQDRKVLERAACECYSVVYDEYVRLGLL